MAISKMKGSDSLADFIGADAANAAAKEKQNQQ
jgi:hypothetical protein